MNSLSEAATAARYAAAEEPLLTKLRLLWESALARSPIGLDEDFFALGGDSLVAAILFAEIERELHRSLPLTTIYEYPTVAMLAQAIAEEKKETGDGIVLLREGFGNPLFFVHGIGGSVMQFTAVTREIDGTMPVYGIEARGITGAAPPRETVAEIALAYNAAIRKIQPCGPYRLAGYSFGGVVAHEMAIQLQRSGCDIGLLALIDSYSHPAHWPLNLRLAVLGQRFRHRLVLSEGIGGALRYLLWRSALFILRMMHRWKIAPDSITNLAKRELTRLQPSSGRHSLHPLQRRTGRFDPPEGLPAFLRHMQEVHEAALLRHQPGRFEGRINFIRAGTSLWYPPDPAPLWRHLAARFDIITVPGEHLELIGSKAGGVGAALSGLLESSGHNSPREPLAPGRLHLTAPETSV